MPSFHNSFCYLGVWTLTAVPDNVGNNIYLPILAYSFDSWQNKHMGLEAALYEIGCLAPNLVINVTFDTYMQCYNRYNVCLGWKIEFKEGIHICLSLAFFIGVWIRWFTDSRLHIKYRPPYQVTWCDCASTPG